MKTPSISLGLVARDDPSRVRDTLESLYAYTTRPFDLTLLGDGSPTALAEFDSLPQSSTEVVRGNAACFNRLIERKLADLYLLLEAGAKMSPCWLDYLLAALERYPKCGLVGPSTNRAANSQRVFPGAEGTPEEINRIARTCARRYGNNCRSLQPLYSLADFCYLVRREVIETIGRADETYGSGPFWEADYNVRAARAKFQGLWACASYIHRAPPIEQPFSKEVQPASRRVHHGKFSGLGLPGHESNTSCPSEACRSNPGPANSDAAETTASSSVTGTESHSGDSRRKPASVDAPLAKKNGSLPKGLKDFRGLHDGATLVVCGCGTSLNLLADPQRFITIGVNDVGRLFHPNYLVVVNPRDQFQADRFRYVEESHAEVIFTQLNLGLQHPHVVRFNLGRRAGTNFHDPNVLHYTTNSPYIALCLAVHMGARRIGVIGVDFTHDHFFAETGVHALERQLSQIDREYKHLYAECVRRGIEVFNLSPQSRLTAFPKLSLPEFEKWGTAKCETPAGTESLKVVSYSTSPVAGVPAILARCIASCTKHSCRTVWATNSYGNGVVFDGDVEWQKNPKLAYELLQSADLVIVHNGKIDSGHRSLLDNKPVITMAHNYIWNVDTSYVQRGLPGVVVGQYQATLPEFNGWKVVPNPIPLWEPAYRPGEKLEPLTICYTPSGKHETYPKGHRLYWHSKGYETTMRVLERLAQRFPIRLEVILENQVSHAQSLAMKKDAHIVIDECVTGSYHRNSLEGLALGCVVVNGVGSLPQITEMFRRCAAFNAEVPFAYAGLDDLERVLVSLIEKGPEALAAQGKQNRDWMERHWDFHKQWECFWEASVSEVVKQPQSTQVEGRMLSAPSASGGKTSRELKSGLSVVVCHGGERRLPLLSTSLVNLRQCSGVDEIIVVDMGVTPFAESLARRLADKYVFVRNDDVFERARCLNVGTALAECDLVFWMDDDLILPRDLIAGTIAEMRVRQLDYLVPYRGIHYLSETDSQKVMDGTINPTDCVPTRTLRALYICGGAGLVRKAFVLAKGGLSEMFRGWGGEDGAWWHKANLLGRAALVQQRDYYLYHLFHLHSGANGGSQHRDSNPYYADNVALLSQMRSHRDRQSYLKRYPPQPLFSRAWEDKRLVLVGGDRQTTTGYSLSQVGQALTDLTGIQIEPLAQDSWECAARSQPDALLMLSASHETAFASSASSSEMWKKCVIVCDNATLDEGAVRTLRDAADVLCVPGPGFETLQRAGVRPWPLPAPASSLDPPLTTAIRVVQPLSKIIGEGMPQTRVKIPIHTDEDRGWVHQAHHGQDSTFLSDANRSQERSARMTANGNIFACLVHENIDCVIDLVRNLRYLDPDSLIILYNGGSDPCLLDSHFPFERFGAVVHPHPQRLSWGRLHPFALDCMQFALDHYVFRTLTVVDSDQLAMRPGYSLRLAEFLDAHSGVGMLGNSSAYQPPGTLVSPAQSAHKEIDLWRPFLQRFHKGTEKFVCWSFWPSTVFTAEAARELTRLFATDRMLQDIMTRTKIWASEEVILPTLVALLGYQILNSPWSYEFVQYRIRYTLPQLTAAQMRNDIFWLHPVPRVYNDPLRSHLRTSLCNYEKGFKPEGAMSVSKSQPDVRLLLTLPILSQMKQIEGWLAEDEADLLVAATVLALTGIPGAQALVEVGSYCGRSTCVIGSVVKTLRPSAKLYAIDPHDGRVGALDQGIKHMPPTLEKLKHNLSTAGLTDLVDIIVAPSWDVAWDKPTSLIFIDGLHDYVSVAQDFYHFEPSLVPGGYVAFHDYADYYPGVKTFVNELLLSGCYEKIHCASSMIVMRRTSESAPCAPQENSKGG